MDEIINEFLIESNEYLDQLDRDLVELEKKTYDQELLARVFRAFHTIKGTSGFLSFLKLEALTHEGEGLLTQLRDGVQAPHAEIISALLALVDAIRNIMTHIEASEQEGDEDYSDLVETLRRLQEQTETPAEAAHEEPAITDGATPTEGAISEGAEPAAEAKDQQPAPPVPGQKLSAREKTLALLRQLHQDFGQPIALADLASARGIAAGTVRNQLTQLKKDGLVNMFGDNTYEPASGVAVVTSSEGVRPEQAVETFPIEAPMELEIPTTPPNGSEPSRPLADNTIRVNVELLDELMNLVGELVLTRNQLMQMVRGQRDSEFTVPLQRLSHVTTDLQEGVMQTRMQPIGNAWAKLPRIVRDLAIELDKKIELEMRGADTELDRQVLELIKDPLTHMVRNSGDHGIESPAERVAAGLVRGDHHARRGVRGRGEKLGMQIELDAELGERAADLGRVVLVDLAPGLWRMPVMRAPVGIERAEQPLRRDHLAERPQRAHRAFLLDEEARVDL
ncbi:MAG: Hpt domain-containing protein, partial [Bacteroidetes bacterium]|nr:Hpt domain-containing protein [Bacteroidota bacterium]